MAAIRAETLHRPTLNQKGFPLNPNIVPLPERRETDKAPWWQEAVIYQIYPATFKDSNGDGVGDVRGITQKLDYLSDLGVGAIWLSPIYPSPMKDGGYDVADYEDVDPQFGTLEDFDTLVKEAHARNMRVVTDLVMNHTSDKHPWFEESQDPHSAKSDWYVWADGKPDGSPPNNWQSFFGGPAWTYSERRGQWYLHKFAPEQPDLNLWNRDVQDAMVDAMTFWLERGVDGFRFDVIDHTFHAQDLADMGRNPRYQEGQEPIEQFDWREKYLLSQAYDFIREKIVPTLEAYGAVSIGEIRGGDMAHLVRIHEAGVHLPINFDFKDAPFEPTVLKRIADAYAAALPNGEWATVFGCHDSPRLATKIGEERMVIATVLQHTLPGTPIIYQGDEIGMKNGYIPANRHRDPQVLRLGVEWSRDPARTPMQWDDSQTAGFSTEGNGHLYLPIGDNRNGLNVREQEKYPDSLLNLNKALTRIRKENPALREGRYVAYTMEDNNVFAFGRETDKQQVLVVTNFSDEQERLRIPDNSYGVRLFSTHRDNGESFVAGSITLEPRECCIIDLRPVLHKNGVAVA